MLVQLQERRGDSYAIKRSCQRAAERAFARARHDPVSAIYEKRRPEILDWKYRELRV